MLRYVLLLSTAAFCFQPLAATWHITFPKAEFEGDKRAEYPRDLLDLALSKTNVRYTINPSEDYLRQNKAIRKLKENIEINVVWSMTDKQREEEMTPIRIPIAKGLIGWRMLVSHKNTPFYRQEVSNFVDLLAFTPVQGIDWPDTKILQASGFNVVTSQDMLEGYELLQRKEVDFFPRSVIEVLQELNIEQKNTSLAFKPKLAIRYPSAMYFFVNKRNKTLAKLIETGLYRAIDDGSFDKLFLEYHGEMLEKFDLERARVFQIENPLLPYLTPIFDERLWYDPVSQVLDTLK
jgi:spermidine/putrescine-binding protein